MTPKDEQKIYTKEVAKRLGVTPTTVRTYFKDENFPKPLMEKRGRQRLYYLTESLLREYKKIVDKES